MMIIVVITLWYAEICAKVICCVVKQKLEDNNILMEEK